MQKRSRYFAHKARRSGYCHSWLLKIKALNQLGNKWGFIPQLLRPKENTSKIV